MFGTVPFDFRLAWKSGRSEALVGGEEAFHVAVQGTRDTLSMSLPYSVTTVPSPAELTGGVRAELELISVAEMFVRQMENMFAVALHGAPALVPMSEAVAVHEMMAGIYRSAESRRAVRFG
jgi:predicted dehydrogenase